MCIRDSPCGIDSMLFIMVAPVLLNPDIVSKKASVILGIYPVSYTHLDVYKRQSADFALHVNQYDSQYGI